MQFDNETSPDTIAECLALLQAANPRFRLSPPTASLFRTRLRLIPEDVLRKATDRWIETRKGFPDLAEFLTECRMHATSSGAPGASLDLPSEEFEKLSLFDRWMLAHAKDVLWAAEYERRGSRVPGHLAHLHVNTELIAHGVQISSDGARVRYDARAILRPMGCPLVPA